MASAALALMLEDRLDSALIKSNEAQGIRRTYARPRARSPSPSQKCADKAFFSDPLASKGLAEGGGAVAPDSPKEVRYTELLDPWLYKSSTTITPPRGE